MGTFRCDKVVADLRPKSRLVFDVHLMVEKPESFVPWFIEAGADIITFHTEACVHVHQLLSAIRGAGKKAGISIVPTTPVSALEEILPFIDLALVMTVNPGFGGQHLIPECLKKVEKLVKMREERGLFFLISTDGGVCEDTARAFRDAGADALVTGSAFFAAADKAALVKKLKGVAI